MLPEKTSDKSGTFWTPAGSWGGFNDPAVPPLRIGGWPPNPCGAQLVAGRNVQFPASSILRRKTFRGI